MPRSRFWLAPTALLVALSVTAVGDECTASTSEGVTLETQVVTLDSTQDWLAMFYVVNDLCQPQCMFSVWIYQESNGVEGLQRDDLFHDDTCDGLYLSDHIIF